MTCPDPAPDEVVVRVMASGICGTDVHIFRGEYLGGYPVIPGHEFAGVVEAVGSQVTRFQVGDRVAVEPNIACDNCEACLNNRQNFCQNWQAVGVTRLGGMAQCTTAPEKVVFPIGDLSFEAGAFVEPLSCVLHGLERLDPEMADKVVILGAGPIGMLLLQGVRLRGASQVTVVDKNEARLRLPVCWAQIRSDQPGCAKNRFLRRRHRRDWRYPGNAAHAGLRPPGRKNPAVWRAPGG
jgi:D-arabinitol dehydrogenase (NADP+)